MIKVDHKASGFARAQSLKMQRLSNLGPADKAAKRAVMKHNRGLKFRARHRSSHLTAENGRVEVGSSQPGYFKLMNMDGEHLTSIYAAWVIEGSTRG